jgi:hypothetical protein
VKILLLFLILILLLPFKNDGIKGLWIDEKQEGIWYFDNDSLISVSLDLHIKFKGKYKLRKDSLLYYKVYKEYYYPELSKGWIQGRISINCESLVYYGQDTIKLLKSRFDDYYDHFVNSNNLKINLPNSSFTNKRFSGEKCLDIFIGFDNNHNEKIKIFDSVISNKNQLLNIIDDFKSNLDSPFNQPLCRLFIDKSVKMGTINDFQDILKENGLFKLMYVSKSPDHKKYDVLFRGIRINISKNS